jgi:hypothetical protein
VVVTAETDRAYPQVTDADQVAECTPPATWSVEERAWTDVAPGLSEETTALLAPPVVVCAEACDLRLK